MRKTSHTQYQEPLLEYILSWIRFRMAEKYITKNSVVADLGCGYYGNFLKHLSSKIKHGVGYDVSVTKAGLPKNITLKRADLNKKISDSKNHYDFVTALAVIEHVANPKKFINNIKEMLKKDGKLIITTPHKRSRKTLEFLSLWLGMVSKDEIRDHKNYFDEATLQKLLQESGFNIIKLETFEFGKNLLCIGKKLINGDKTF